MSRLKADHVVVFSNQGAMPALEDHCLSQQERGIFALADGFGGPSAGLGAARTACESLSEYLSREAGDPEATLPFELRSYYTLAGNVLFNAFLYANTKVHALNSGKNVHEKGGASAIAGFLEESTLALAQVGACSAVLFRDGRSLRLMEPRTLARMRDPFASEDAGVPLVSLGTSKDLQPEIVEHRLCEGDVLLLQSCGVPRGFEQEVRSWCTTDGQDPSRWLDRVKPAMQSFQFTNNASFLLIHFSKA
jgi:serine/threonine protein phosphatase PrpC